MAGGVVLLSSCMHLPEATPEEREICQAWAERVPPNIRQKITRDADAHTSWTEKKRVAWMTEQFFSAAQEEAQHPTKPATRGSHER